MKPEWKRVTKKHPCPICGKPDWCCYTADGRVVLCMRTPNDHPSRGDAGGWVYKQDRASCAVAPSTLYAERDDEHIPKNSVDSLLAEWQKNTTGIGLSAFARDLGVTRASLERLGCVWCAGQSCWAFPMRNAKGEPIGIRLRSRTRKYSVCGSRTGLFFDPGAKASRVAWLTEGPTDTAAVLSIAPNALVVGRSDLLSAWKTLRAALSRLGVEEANICVDNELEKVGRRDNPGRAGSMRLAEALGIPCRFISVPGFKDIREYVRDGGKMDFLKRLASGQKKAAVVQ